MKKLRTMGCLTVVLTLVGGCNQKEEQKASSELALEPVTITVGIQTGGAIGSIFNSDKFNTYVVDPVKKRFPHITIGKVALEGGTPEEALQKASVSGSMPQTQGRCFPRHIDDVSDEVQLEMSRDGIMTARSESKFQDAYGTNLPYLAGKNLKAIFKSTPATYPLPSKYDGIATPIMEQIIPKLISGEKDTNTALREAEEQINKAIASQGAKTN